MRKRSVIFVVIVAFLLAGVFVALWNREPPEPEYGGKKLSEWIDHAQPFSPDDAVRWQNQTAEALRQIGTKAIPFLVKWVRDARPDWQVLAYHKLDELRNKPPNWSLFRDRNRRLASGSAAALCNLGKGASSAIPDLSRILKHPRSARSAMIAAEVLKAIGADVELVGGLTNKYPEVRESVARLVYGSGTNVRTALKNLYLYYNGSETMRVAVSNGLRQLDAEEAQAKGGR